MTATTRQVTSVPLRADTVHMDYADRVVILGDLVVHREHDLQDPQRPRWLGT
ncbi:hypothetical protein [Streptomyces sp. NPDC046332]|uniref:hypothetical protein n=1 Tax=Streptomyces sp. NPDC046332 TaxID=3155133 RepID=UPI0034044CF5